MNVRSDSDGLERLINLGFRHVPVIAVGDRGVMGDRLQEVAELVGIKAQLQQGLEPAELAQRLELVLRLAAGYYRQVPPQHLAYLAPESRRDVRQLGFHLVRIGDGYLKALDGFDLTNEYLGEDPPATVQTGEELATLMEAVADSVAAWHRGGGTVRLQQKTIKTYLGERGAHDFLERTAWHIAQHIRQLMVIAERLNFPVDRPLTDEDVKGLPLPEQIWV